jgi:hypothetical protein
LENISDSEGINRVWKNIKENIRTPGKQSLGLHELKHHKPWTDDECLRYSDQRKHAKIQWLQDPNQNIIDDLNNVKVEASTYFRNKIKGYLRAKVYEFNIKYYERRNRFIPFLV